MIDPVCGILPVLIAAHLYWHAKSNPWQRKARRGALPEFTLNNKRCCRFFWRHWSWLCQCDRRMRQYPESIAGQTCGGRDCGCHQCRESWETPGVEYVWIIV